MIDTTRKPDEVVFNDVIYRLMGTKQYYLSQSKENSGRKGAKGLEWHQKNKINYSKSVTMFSLDGNRIKDFPSIVDAAYEIGGCSSSIGKCAKGKQKTSGGYIWKFTSDIK